MKLHLGCGRNILSGYVNLDRNSFGENVVRDVRRGLPFDDDKFDEVYSAHFLEHIPQGEEVFFVLSEIWRVARDGAKVKTVVPHSETPYAFFPDHLSYWNEEVVKAICSDPYQRDSKHQYNFELVGMRREGLELIFDMAARKAVTQQG